jgi:hypothetical protein
VRDSQFSEEQEEGTSENGDKEEKGRIGGRGEEGEGERVEVGYLEIISDKE